MTGALAHYLGTDRKGVRIFLTISLSACVYWFLSIKTVVYEPFRQALDVTNTQLGVLLSITGFVQVFGYVALGWLQDSLQIRKVIAVDLVAYALLALTLAVLPDLPFWWLCCVFAGFGLFGEALYWPTIQKATRGLSGPAHQAALFSTQEALRGAMGLAANFVTLTLFLAGGLAHHRRTSSNGLLPAHHDRACDHRPEEHACGFPPHIRRRCTAPHRVDHRHGSDDLLRGVHRGDHLRAATVPGHLRHAQPARGSARHGEHRRVPRRLRAGLGAGRAPVPDKPVLDGCALRHRHIPRRCHHGDACRGDPPCRSSSSQHCWR